MTAAWNRLWIDFRSIVEELNKAVQPEEHGFVVRVDKDDSDAFPLRAMASYSPKVSPGDEALVFSVDFKRTDDRVEGRVDLARGDGIVIADEPLGAAFEDDQAAVESVLRTAAIKLNRFVTSSRELVERELSGQEPDEPG